MNLSKISTLTFAVILIGLAVTNEFQMIGMHSTMSSDSDMSSIADAGDSSGSSSQDAIARIASQVIPRGVPTVKAKSGTAIDYGQELGVSFDTAAEGIRILAQHEQDTRVDKLTGEKLERYIKIGSVTSCEYCCTATTMVFPDGRKACGCAHSAAMRGVVAYLLDNYGDELTDDQIITEVNRFKATYFPRQSVEKVMASSEGGSVDMSALNQLSPQVGGC